MKQLTEEQQAKFSKWLELKARLALRETEARRANEAVKKVEEEIAQLVNGRWTDSLRQDSYEYQYALVNGHLLSFYVKTGQGSMTIIDETEKAYQ